MTERMFPLQTSRHATPGPTQIPWCIAEKAYGAYAAQYGKGQSLERLAERGGFGWCEMDTLYPAWRAEVDELVQLRAEVARLTKERDAARAERDFARMCKPDEYELLLSSERSAHEQLRNERERREKAEAESAQLARRDDFAKEVNEKNAKLTAERDALRERCAELEAKLLK